MRHRVMSSLLGRGLLARRFLMLLLTGLSLTTACASKSPTEPGSASKTLSPNISIVSMSVASETLVSGARVYRVMVKLRESGGAAATIAAVDLTFMNGSSVVASSHVDRPISDAANVLTPNSTMDSRELMTLDDDPSHPHATSVTAKVTYTDGASMTSSAAASAEVPMSSAPTFTLSGLVSEENTAGRAIAGATVRVVDGANAGRTSSTDGNGKYTLPDLAGGSFSVRATANGYNATERTVTIAQDTTLDLRLLRTPGAPAPAPLPPSPSACAYTVAPTASGIDYKGGSLTATISRTSGNCSWQASSDVSWITFPGGTSGNGSATLTYVVGANGLNTRSGSIRISWAGGTAQLRVQQGNVPDTCSFTLAKGPQDFNNVPSAGGQLTVTATTTGMLPCQVLASPNVAWISLSGSAFGGTFIFTVAPNPSPGTARTGSVLFSSPYRGENIEVTQR